ncbi:MAG TPA: glycosyltransferase family 2 protein [Solirubrobacteraceae bacterium]|nr:glycosyltransferase family 2 protein [Solirubrobacteraceae bacterium]
MPGRPDVSILIVTFEHGDEIDACLDAALAQARDGLAVEVIVADNASRDETGVRVAARAGDAVRLLPMGTNRGFAAAVNAAFALARGEHVLILNPDCVMDAGCALALREHLRARPDVALAAALLRDPDGTPQLHARRDIGLPGVLWAYTTVGRRVDARLRGGRALAHRRYEELWAGGPPREPVAVFCPAAACVLGRRAELEPAPLDERFALFFNDGDLCARLKAAGRGVEIVPAATAAHGYGTSVRRAQRADPARMRAEWVASLRRYAARHWRRPQRAALAALLLADAVVSAGLCLARREDPREVRGVLGGLGLPGGASPLLTPVRTVRARRAAAAAAVAPGRPPAGGAPGTPRR